MDIIDTNVKYMRLALEQAHIARQRDEVPIGAVVVCKGMVIAAAHNLTETLCDPTAHAEMQAITAACSRLGGKYLKDCTLFVTVEPCPMCATALKWAQVSEIVMGTTDQKFGYSTISNKLLHPKTIVKYGVLEDECRELMQSFFKAKR